MIQELEHSSANRLRETLRDAMERTRARTLWLLDQVPEEYLKVRVHSFYSPIGWHFGHVGRTEEFWICHKALGLPVVDDHLSFLFADLPDNPKDNRVHLPSREQIVEYLSITRARTLQALEQVEFAEDDPFLKEGYAFDFAVQHECQHQETICEMLQLISKQTSGRGPLSSSGGGEGVRGERPTHYIEIPAGTFTMGTNATRVYDNEQQAHEVEVKAFKLAKTQVTSAEWSNFIQDGGYRKRELWSSQGWAWRETENAEHPEYWRQTANGYLYIAAHGLRAIHPQEPASSISWFEAEAFLKW